MEFEVVITGRGGHGSRPDKAINPVDCFAAVFGALQGTFCEIRDVDGGNAATIVPEKLRFTGTCQNLETLRMVVEHVCAAYQCRVVVAEK